MRTTNLLVSSFADVQAQTNALFRLVRPESLHDRPIPDLGNLWVA